MLQSAKTTLHVFETVAKSEPIGVSEVARSLHISTSTAQRCLKVLQETGWIRVDETASVTRWMITAKAFSLGQRVTEHGHLREIAMPVMGKLWNTVQESVLLSVAEGQKTVLLEQYESPNPIRMQIPRGAWSPMHLVPSGKIMLAYSDKEFSEKYLAAGLAAMTENTITDPEQMRRELEKIRRQGWSISIDELVKGASGAAAPIFGWDGRNLAALAITLPTVRFPQSVRKKYVSLLVDAAAEISRSFKDDKKIG